MRYGDKLAVAAWVRELDKKQQRSAIEDREGDLTAGAWAAGDRERNGLWNRVPVRKGGIKICSLPSLQTGVGKET